MGKLPGNTGGKGFPKLKFIEQLRSKLVISTIWRFQDGQWGSMDQRIWWPFWPEKKIMCDQRMRTVHLYLYENMGKWNAPVLYKHSDFWSNHCILYGSDKDCQNDSQTYHLANHPTRKPSFHPPVCFILFGCFFSAATVDGWNPYIRWSGIKKTPVDGKNLARPGMHEK